MSHEGKSSVGFWIVLVGKCQFPSSCSWYYLIWLSRKSPRGLWILLKYWRYCIVWYEPPPNTWQHSTSNRDTRLVLHASSWPRDLRSVAVVSCNFLQRANTSVSCHTYWDLSQSKQTAFLLPLFFPIIAQGPDWHNIQRRVGFTAAH